jgi:tRNA(Ile)-lysidine synthase
MDCNLDIALKNFCEQHGCERTYWIAYSGGLDSHVLLHLFARLKKIFPLRLKAVHINHSLSPNAGAWQLHCTSICRELNIELVHVTVQAKAQAGASPEETARDKRYEVLSGLLTPNDLLLTAHHQDDQAETLLLQLLRGAGPKGLAAMPTIKLCGVGWQARPLLAFTRAELLAYATTHPLVWIEDESNNDLHFSRNYLRREVMPLLKTRWPSVTDTFARVASHCAEMQALCDEMGAADLAAAAGSTAQTLSVSYLLTLSPARQRQVLRMWIKQLNYFVPDTLKLQQIQREILHARADKNPHVAWKNVDCRRYRDDIFVMKRLPASQSARIFAWDLQQPLNLADMGILHASLKQGEGLRAPCENVTVRFRQGGEVCQLPKRNFTSSLKKLFWEWNVAPWERERLPLIFVGDKLAAAPGFFIGAEFKADAEESGYVVSFEKFV